MVGGPSTAGPARPILRVVSGLASGEGVIYHVRDSLEGKEPVKEKGRVVEYQDVIVDHGVTDKRLMVVETEFARPLQVMKREGTTLSAILRQAWDGGHLRSLTKSFPYQASGAHISTVGHVTSEELHRLLTSADLSNGFANRFLWIACRRTKRLPFGGNPPAELIAHFQNRLREAVEAAKRTEYVGWSRDARAIWAEQYPALTAPAPRSAGKRNQSRRGSRRSGWPCRPPWSINEASLSPSTSWPLWRSSHTPSVRPPTSWAIGLATERKRQSWDS